MASRKRAPKRNVLRRRARREAEHRRRERTFWGIFFFGWPGLLYAWFTNSGERARQQRFDTQYRHRRDDALEDDASDPDDQREAPAPHAAAPRASDRTERDALRRAARRRRLVRTASWSAGS